MGAQPRIAELIKGFAGLRRIFEERLAIAPAETTRDVIEELMTLIRGWGDKPLLTDDQAIKQGTTIGTAVANRLIESGIFTNLKMNLEPNAGYRGLEYPNRILNLGYAPNFTKKTTQHVVVKGVASLAGLQWLLDLTLCPAMNYGNSS